MSATPNNQFEADRLRMVVAAMRKVPYAATRAGSRS